MVAVLDHHQFDRPLHLARQALGVFRGNDAVEPPVHDENGTGDFVRHAFERQRIRIFARLFVGLAMAAHAERFARQLRQPVPGLGPIKRPAERDAGLDTLVERGCARGVIAAEADAPHADARGVEIAVRRHVIEHGLDWHFVVAADGEIVLRLALAGPVKNQRRHSARQERCFIGLALFLGGIKPDRHRHHRRPLDAGRLTQDAGQRLALVRDLDALAGRTQIWQRRLAAFDLLLVRGLHLRDVAHEQKRREMIVDAGALQAFAGGEEMLLRQRRAAELLMMCSARRPGAAPVAIGGERASDFLEIGEHDAVGDETRAPMRNRGLEQGVG